VFTGIVQSTIKHNMGRFFHYTPNYRAVVRKLNRMRHGKVLFWARLYGKLQYKKPYGDGVSKLQYG